MTVENLLMFNFVWKIFVFIKKYISCNIQVNSHWTNNTDNPYTMSHINVFSDERQKSI